MNKRVNIKISQIQNKRKIIKLIHQKTKQPPFQIMKKINKNDYVLSCNYFNLDELKSLKEILEETKKIGASITIFVNDKIITEEDFHNWLNNCEQVKEKNSTIIEKEIGNKKIKSLPIKEPIKNNFFQKKITPIINKFIVFFFVLFGIISIIFKISGNYFPFPIESIISPFIFIIGIIWVITYFNILKETEKKFNKRIINFLLLILGFFTVFISYNKLTNIYKDIKEGPIEITLEKCSVSYESYRGIYTYYLNGEVNKEKLEIEINRTMYNQYKDIDNFTTQIIYYQHSQIIKDIQEAQKNNRSHNYNKE